MSPSRRNRTALRDLDLHRHLENPATKQHYVTTMFDLVAPRYDRFTRWFSYGLDGRWKRQLLELAAIRTPPDTVVLDAACGTGDLALGLAATRPDVNVVGLDPSSAMLAGFRRRCRDADASAASRNRPVRLVRGDLTFLPIPAASIGAVTVGYGLRNVPDMQAVLAELHRVLGPGGWLLTLDFFHPTSKLWSALWLRYLRMAGRWYGWWWHREPNAYGYIAESVRRFVTDPEFRAALERAGFEVVVSHRKLGGGIGLHAARRL